MKTGTSKGELSDASSAHWARGENEVVKGLSGPETPKFINDSVIITLLEFVIDGCAFIVCLLLIIPKDDWCATD